MEPAGYLRHREAFEVGPFRVTPYLNDHSAYDAYSLLIEAGGRRLFYSGDIRGHGRKAALFEQLVADPPAGVDVLLMEGTNVRPEDDGPRHLETESEVEAAMAETMRTTPGMVLAISSGQNIDRLVTIYRAAKRTGRHLVMDLYTAAIVAATGNPNIPHPGPEWPLVHVYLPLWQRMRVKDAKAFSRTAAVRPYRVYEEWLAEHRREVVLLFSAQSGPALARAGCLDGASAIWSLWHGYLAEPSGERLHALPRLPRDPNDRAAHLGARLGRRPATTSERHRPRMPRADPHLRGRPLQGTVRQRM